MPNLRARWWVALALIVSASVAAGAYGRSTERSFREGDRANAAWGQPGTVPNPCSRPDAVRGKPVAQTRTMCGAAGADKMTVPGGAAIAAWSLGGNDKIYARSGPAHVYGGPGRDQAVVLSAAAATWGPDTETVYDVNGRKLSSTRAPQGPTTDFDPSKVPLIQVRIKYTSARCANATDGGWYVRFADEPTLRAFNTIPGKVEFQKVAYAVGLDRWDVARQGWFRVRTNPWLWDETYDVDYRPFPGNFWRSFDTLDRRFTRFNVAAGDPGYYRLIVAYYWYGATQSYGSQTVRIPDYLKSEWVTTHFNLSNDKTARYPKDKYCTFGVDPGAGP
jgi:hypothetical protein